MIDDILGELYELEARCGLDMLKCKVEMRPIVAMRHAKKLAAYIADREREARINELERIICHKHGFGKDSCPQIVDRLAALNQSVKEGVDNH